ncbi:hypothetical protein D3C81_1771420 [compost metagenome]
MFALVESFTTVRKRHEYSSELTNEFENGLLFLHSKHLHVMLMPSFESRVVAHQSKHCQIQIFSQLPSPSLGEHDLPLTFSGRAFRQAKTRKRENLLSMIVAAQIARIG